MKTVIATNLQTTSTTTTMMMLTMCILASVLTSVAGQDFTFPSFDQTISSLPSPGGFPSSGSSVGLGVYDPNNQLPTSGSAGSGLVVYEPNTQPQPTFETAPTSTFPAQPVLNFPNKDLNPFTPRGLNPRMMRALGVVQGPQGNYVRAPQGYYKPTAPTYNAPQYSNNYNYNPSYTPVRNTGYGQPQQTQVAYPTPSKTSFAPRTFGYAPRQPTYTPRQTYAPRQTGYNTGKASLGREPLGYQASPRSAVAGGKTFCNPNQKKVSCPGNDLHDCVCHHANTYGGRQWFCC